MICFSETVEPLNCELHHHRYSGSPAHITPWMPRAEPPYLAFNMKGILPSSPGLPVSRRGKTDVSSSQSPANIHRCEKAKVLRATTECPALSRLVVPYHLPSTSAPPLDDTASDLSSPQLGIWFPSRATPCGEASSWPISYSHTSLKYAPRTRMKRTRTCAASDKSSDQGCHARRPCRKEKRKRGKTEN